jgi:hypothetical protein
MGQALAGGNPLAMLSPTDTIRETMRAQPRKLTLLLRLIYQAEIRPQPSRAQDAGDGSSAVIGFLMTFAYTTTMIFSQGAAICGEPPPAACLNGVAPGAAARVAMLPTPDVPGSTISA